MDVVGWVILGMIVILGILVIILGVLFVCVICEYSSNKKDDFALITKDCHPIFDDFSKGGRPPNPNRPRGKRAEMNLYEDAWDRRGK